MDKLTEGLTEAAASVGTWPSKARDALQKASEQWATAALANLQGKERTKALRISAVISDFVRALDS